MCKFIIEKKELKGGLKEALNILKQRAEVEAERKREREKLYTSRVKREFINNVNILHTVAIQNNLDIAEEQEHIGYTEKIYRLSETEYLQWEDDGYNFQYVNEEGFRAEINELSDLYLFELLMKAVNQLEVLR